MLRRIPYRLLCTLFSVLLLCACSDSDGTDVDNQQNVGNIYVNFAISVTNGNSGMRDATPEGDEDGDGREAGILRENTISGITVILYQADATGINTEADPTLDLVRYFPVSERATGTMPIEVTYYTTGQQPLGKHNLDLTKEYHAIVIANAPEVAASLTEGTSKLSDIRDVTLSTIYTGNPSYSADNITNFVMSSEEDNTINFGSVTGTNLDGSTHTPGKDMYYDLTTQPVIIERLAARIDFWSKKSNGYKTTTDNPAYTIPGYEYNVTGSTDKFVVTGIVPFNLVNGITDYGKEYLLKRLRTDIAVPSTTSYLADETSSTYVIDPMTMSKVTDNNPVLTSSLEKVYDLIGDAGKLENTTDNPYYHSIEAMHGSSSKSDIDFKENVVVAYPMENCLLPESKLYYHATGIAIIGYYYVNGTGTGTRYVYLGYLRHQGDAESYDIQPYTTPLAKDATMGSTPAMKFGVVRNNIYRVSINSIDKKGTLELSIKVKKWDTFTHSWIYM